MTHTPNSITHYACEEMMNKYGGDAECCACTKHECETFTLYLCKTCGVMKNHYFAKGNYYCGTCNEKK